MSKQPEIDQIFQKRLYDATAEPPAFVWQNVEKALRRKRRRVVFWFLGGTLLLGSIGIFAWWSSSAHQPNPTAIPERNTPIARTAAPSSTNPYTAGSQAASVENTFAAQPKVSAETAVSNNMPRYTTPAIHDTNHRGTVLDNQPKQNVSYTASKTGILETKSSDTTEKDPSTADIPLTAPETTPHQDNTDISAQPQTLTTALALTTLSALEPEWLVTKQANAQIRQIKIARGKRTKKYKNCYDFASHSKVFLLDGYLGLSAARKDLRIGLPESTPYRDRREATERNSWAFNGGIRSAMLFNQNFLVRAGLHYDQLTEIFEYQDPKYKKETINITTRYVNGVPVISYDTTITYGNNFIKTYNRFGMLEIPLEAGFEMRKLRSGISIQLGASFNVLFWKRGKIMTPSDIPASIDPDDNAYNTYKSNLGVSVIGSVQWFYHIRPTLRVFAEPYYRHILRPVTISSHPLEQRYGIGGVRLGLTKILN